MKALTNSSNKIFNKLTRYARKLHLSKTDEECADSLGDFCITYIALRDWVLKEKSNIISNEEDFYTEWKKDLYQDICINYGNYMKHSELRNEQKNPIEELKRFTQELHSFSIDENAPKYKIYRPSFNIYLKDGSQIEGFDFMIKMIRLLMQLVKKYNIDISPYKNENEVVLFIYMEELDESGQSVGT